MRLRLVLPVLITALAAAPSAQEAARAPQRPRQERAAPSQAPVVAPARTAPGAQGAQELPRRRAVPAPDLQDPVARAQHADALDARIAALKRRAARAEAAGNPIAPERIRRHMEKIRQLEEERAALGQQDGR